MIFGCGARRTKEVIMLLGHQEFTEWACLTDTKNIPAASNISNTFGVGLCGKASLASLTHE
jgi:hypothetical protein